MPSLKTRIAVLEAVSKVERKASRRALKVAKNELARRLDILNHAHDAMVADRSMFLRADEYAKSEGLHQTQREVADAKTIRAELKIDRLATIGTVLFILLGLAVPVITALIIHAMH
jgi:hypothetical protein